MYFYFRAQRIRAETAQTRVWTVPQQVSLHCKKTMLKFINIRAGQRWHLGVEPKVRTFWPHVRCRSPRQNLMVFYSVSTYCVIHIIHTCLHLSPYSTVKRLTGNTTEKTLCQMGEELFLLGRNSHIFVKERRKRNKEHCLRNRKFIEANAFEIIEAEHC